MYGKDKIAFAQFVVAMAYFESEKHPYKDVKHLLKQSLLTIQSASTEEVAFIDKLNLMRLVLHNLAVINYCEILDYNERLQIQLEEGIT